MTGSTLVLVIVAAGAATLLIRLLPMLWQQKGAKKSRSRPLLRNVLEAIGPAAIVALLSVSLWGMVAAQPSTEGILPVIMGLLGVLVGKKTLGSIASATLGGVLAYGTTLWLLSVTL